MSKPSMWRCESCGAPNLQASISCYHCKRERQLEPMASAGRATAEQEPVSSAPPGQQAPGPVSPPDAGGAEVSAEATKCSYCGREVAEGVRKCMHCGEWLSEELSPDPPISARQKIIAATIAVLFWFFGIILGCIFLLGERKRLGRFYLQWTLIGFTLWTIAFFSCWWVHECNEYRYKFSNICSDAPVAATAAPTSSDENSEQTQTPPTLEELKTGVEREVQDMLSGSEHFQNDTVISSEVHTCPKPGYDYSAAVKSTDGSNEHWWLYVHRTGEDADAWEPAPSD